jgi:hypothetical protein
VSACRRDILQDPAKNETARRCQRGMNCETGMHRATDWITRGFWQKGAPVPTSLTVPLRHADTSLRRHADTSLRRPHADTFPPGLDQAFLLLLGPLEEKRQQECRYQLADHENRGERFDASGRGYDPD